MTASFFAESSHIPPLVRVAVSRTSLSHELILASGWFGLSLLGRGQEALALGCGTISGRDVDKFSCFKIPRRLTAHGVPLLPHCLTTSECEVVDRLDLPGHTLFVGRIVSSHRQSLLSHRRSLLVSDLVDYLSPAPGRGDARTEP